MTGSKRVYVVALCLFLMTLGMVQGPALADGPSGQDDSSSGQTAVQAAHERAADRMVGVVTSIFHSAGGRLLGLPPDPILGFARSLMRSLSKVIEGAIDALARRKRGSIPTADSDRETSEPTPAPAQEKAPEMDALGGLAASETVEPAPSQEPPAQEPVDDVAAKRKMIVDTAHQQLGKKYVYATSGPDTFDCSGLSMFCYGKVGVSLPHRSAEQATMGRQMPTEELKPGDLVFFHDDLGHVGIYIGDGNYIHAPGTGDVVKMRPLAGGSFVQGRCLLE